MFTGIIETLGVVKDIQTEGTNAHFTIASSLSSELKIDQSLSHNGVCLTVVDIKDGQYTVTAIDETLKVSNLGKVKTGDVLNLERAMSANARLDGHIVQGHVDTIGKCVEIREVDGSWYYTFEYEVTPEHLLVNKGSVCISGVSLTVVKPEGNRFSVAIIPYTYEHTNFHALKVGDIVNLEFDIIGKYIAKYMQIYKQ